MIHLKAWLIVMFVNLPVVTTGSNYRLLASLTTAATMDINKAPIGSVISVDGQKYVKINSQNVLVAAGSFTSQQDQYALKHYQVYGCQNPTGVLQSWDSCASLATPAVGTWTQGPCLADRRDGKTYEIRKYADGHCWMVDNLAYGGDTLWGGKDGCVAHPHSGGVFGANTSTIHDYMWNTDGSGSTSNFGQGYILRGTFGDGTYGTCAVSYTGNFKAYEVFNSNGYGLNDNYSLREFDTYTEALAAADGDTNLVRPRGYHYDWVAATQNPTAHWGGSYDSAQGPDEGICPEGWQLPTGGTNGQWRKLFQAIGGAESGSGGAEGESNAVSRGYLLARWKAPTSGFSRRENGTLDHRSTYGHWWSTTVLSETHAYDLRFNDNQVEPEFNAIKDNGLSVRCIKL